MKKTLVLAGAIALSAALGGLALAQDDDATSSNQTAPVATNAPDSGNSSDSATSSDSADDSDAGAAPTATAVPDSDE